MTQILLIAVMFIVCMVLHKPGMGFKFFLFWLAVCAAVFYFVNPSVGLWGFLCYFIVIGGGSETEKKPPVTTTSNPEPRIGRTVNPDEHTGTGYHPGGDVDYLPNGNTSVKYGNVRYMSNRIHSVNEGKVTYFFDENGRRLGRSVDNGNGVFTYFDDNGREIGRCVNNGNRTDFFGNCFETR